MKGLTFTMVIVQFVNELGKDKTIFARNRSGDSCTDQELRVEGHRTVLSLKHLLIQT